MDEGIRIAEWHGVTQRGLQGSPTPQKAQVIRNHVAQMLTGRR
jgi:hypothetical protein